MCCLPDNTYIKVMGHKIKRKKSKMHDRGQNRVGCHRGHANLDPQLNFDLYSAAQCVHSHDSSKDNCLADR